MTKTVLLFYPKYTYPRKNPPLGLAYLAAYIRQEGFDPVIVDLNAAPHTEEEIRGLMDKYTPLAVGISFMTNQYTECLRLAELIKECSFVTPVFVGGPHVSALPKETLEECADIDCAIIGEGELTLLELLKAYSKGENDFSKIKGICFSDSAGVFVTTQPRALIEDINTLPFPAWDLIDVNKYSVFSVAQGHTFALLSSRGCPNQCIFCDSHTIFGRIFRARSAKNIFSEIEFLNKTYGMTQFDFVDDMITLKKDRVLELCSLLKESDVEYKWMANARVNTIDEEMLRVMKQSGCIRIDVGVESGDAQVRKQLKKGITDEQIVAVHTLARKIGIQIGTFTMVGNLGEDINSVKKTAQLLKDIGQDVMISIACPFPGTELYRIAKEKGYLKITDWSRYVTSPTYMDNYQPVMITDKMQQKDILNAYYYLSSFFVNKKFQARFGKCFFINPMFFKEWVIKAIKDGVLIKRVVMFFSLVRARFTVKGKSKESESKSLKINVICQYFYPEIGAPQARLLEMAKEWVSQGHEVTVLTGFPNHPTGVIPAEYRGKIFMEEWIDGIKVWRHWLFDTPNRGLFKRTLLHISFMISVVVLSLFRGKKPDVLMVSSPAFFSVISTFIISRLRRVPYVFEVRDLWPGIFIELGVLKNKFLIWVLKAMELFLYRASAAVVPVTNGFAQDIIKRGIPENKVCVITNGVDLQMFKSGNGETSLRSELGIPKNRFIVSYIGSHGISHGLYSVIDAAEELQKEEDMHFLFVGEGAVKQRLVKRVKDRNINNVSFIPSQPREKVINFYNLSDVCLVPLKDVPGFSAFIPSKIFEIMACEKPIVACLRGESAGILKESGGASIVAPEDTKEMIKSIRGLKNNPKQCQAMGSRARSFVAKNYDRKKLALKYLQLLQKVGSQRAVTAVNVPETGRG
ncbi:MAG: cobalamin-dependent protein [Candidatus Omnitrophota bacterium]